MAAALTWSITHLQTPAPGELELGDAFCVVEREDSLLVAVIDGLGHGKEACRAASLAVDHVQAHADRPLFDLMDGTHRAIRGTRGAAVALVRVLPARRMLEHASVGNVETRVIAADRVLRPVSAAGIVGYQVRKIHVESFPYAAGDLLVVHSDGISDRFELAPPSRMTDIHLLASQIVHAHGKHNDDQTLLIARLEP